MYLVSSGFGGRIQRHFRNILDPAFAARLGVVLLALCIIIQTRLLNESSPDLPRSFTLFLFIGGLAGFFIAAARWGDYRKAVETAGASSASGRWAWGVAGVSVAAGVIAAFSVSRDEWTAQWWWIAAMTLPVVELSLEAAMHEMRGIRGIGKRVVASWRQIGLLILLAAIALVPRLDSITASPPFLLGDESQCGLFGRLFDAGNTPLLSISWFGLPMFSYAISGVGLWIFGNNFTGLREVNAVIGAAGVLMLYLLGTEWFGRRAGFIAALLNAVWFLPLELSRNGIHYIQGPVCITLSLLLCTVWLKRGGAMPALFAGMSFALDLQVYWSARVGPLLALALIGLTMLRDRRSLQNRLPEVIWVAVGGLAAGLPVLALFHAVPGSFNGHQGDVSIFSSDSGTQGHLVSQYGHISKFSILLQQVWKVLTAFNARGDSASIFGQWGKPILDAVSGALLPAAVALTLTRLKRTEYLVTLAWVTSVAGANAVTIDPPLWNRLLALMPALALLVGVLLSDVWSALAAVVDRRLIFPVIALVLAGITALNFHAAFVDYPAVAGQVSMNSTDVGEFLARAPGAANTVLLSDGEFYVNYEPIRFLAPQSGGCTLFTGQSLHACPTVGTSKLFVLLPGRVKDLAWLQRQRPRGRVVTVATVNYGQDRILAYELPLK